MRWPWTRPDPQPEPDPPEDELTRRLRHLAGHWQRNPGVRPWADLVDEQYTRPLPVVTPAQRHRGEGAGPRPWSPGRP